MLDDAYYVDPSGLSEDYWWELAQQPHWTLINDEMGGEIFAHQRLHPPIKIE